MVKHSVGLWLSLSLLMRLSPWIVNFPSAALGFFNPLRWNRMTRGAWSWLFLFPHVKDQKKLNLVISLQVNQAKKTPVGQALVKQFLLGADLIKKDRMLWHIPKWFHSIPHTRKVRDFSSDFTVRAWFYLLEVKLTKAWESAYDLVPTFLTLKLV